MMGILSETVIAGGLLAANAVQDIRKREILLLPTLGVLAGGVIREISGGIPPTGNGLPLVGNGELLWICGLLPGVLLLLLSLATDEKIGFGDGLTVCAAGVWCGAESVLISLFLALLAVPVFSGVMRLWKRPVRTLPFVPFLLLGFCLERWLFR